MKKFLTDMFSDSNGLVSSKRVAMFIVLIVFLFIVVRNHFTGADVEVTLKNELFYLLGWLVTLVFGEGAVAMFKKGSPKSPDDSQ